MEMPKAQPSPGEIKAMPLDDFAYKGDFPPAAFNMARYCLAAAGRVPERAGLIVVHDPDGKDVETWTYRALEAAILRVACALRDTAKLATGTRVAIRLRNRTSYALSFFGAIAGGLVPIPVSPDLTARELDFILDDSEASAIVLDDTLPHGALPPGLAVIKETTLQVAIESGRPGAFADTSANDPAFLIYTSGTTATPKGVLHAHRSAWGRRPMYQGWYGITAEDRLLHAGSFNWTYTLGTGLTDPWANAASAIVYTGHKEPSLWPKLMKDQGVTIFAAVPGVYRQMLKYSADGPLALPRLRHGLTAGEALPNAVDAEWRERTGTPLFEALGQSEISTYISSSPSVPRKPGAAGKPQPRRSIAIIGADTEMPLQSGEEGLIAVHRTDPGLMLGYWRRPAEEAEVMRGEWFAGGDAGVMDEEGYIVHLGRRNELMNAGGFRVSPLEVEQELAKHPAVSEVAVSEVPLRDGVSIVAAFVVARPGATDGSIEESLRSYAATTLASYKCPKTYVIVETLPRTPNGKVKRAELKRLLSRETT
jgi:acyl-coenzyme A synthetase/AMP-(fatty) acid ligase